MVLDVAVDYAFLQFNCMSFAPVVVVFSASISASTATMAPHVSRSVASVGFVKHISRIDTIRALHKVTSGHEDLRKNE